MVLRVVNIIRDILTFLTGGKTFSKVHVDMEKRVQEAVKEDFQGYVRNV